MEENKSMGIILLMGSEGEEINKCGDTDLLSLFEPLYWSAADGRCDSSDVRFVFFGYSLFVVSSAG